MKKNEFDYSTDISDYAKDGRLTEPSDGKRYDWMKMINLSKKLGRPLTVSESSKFAIFN